MMIASGMLIYSILLAGSASAQKIYQGFNTGNTFPDNSSKEESDFRKEFTTAPKLQDSPGVFNSFRLYTTIQAKTEAVPISAIPAAIKTNTSLLLGIWCSGSPPDITNELSALKAAIDTYGADLASIVIAISVGSEDLYRNSRSGNKNGAGIGTQPQLIAQFINKTRTAVRGTVLADKPIGHVDTWSAWTNASNSAVIDATDFLGVDIYPFFEADKDNTLDRAPDIFETLWNRTVHASRGKPVWVTETGWPYSGDDWGEASASADAQAQYWRAVGCGRLFGRVNTWWYTLRDANPESEEKFAVAGDELRTTPRFNLTCPPGSGAPATVNVSSGAGVAGVSWLLVSLIVAIGFLLV